MILDRIKEYIDHKGISISAFEKSIGMSNASFGKSLKNKGAIGTDKLEKILITYPDLSHEWLLTGRGEMLADGGEAAQQQTRQPPPVSASTALEPRDLLATIREQATEIGRLQERIAQLERENSRLASDAHTSAIADVG